MWHVMGPSSVWRCSQSRRQSPRTSQRRKRLYTASQRPKSFGRSRQGSPVRARYSTASINRRSLSPGGRPARDFKVVRRGAISAHALSVSSKRTDIKFSFLRNRYSGGNVAQIVNSSTRPRFKFRLRSTQTQGHASARDNGARLGALAGRTGKDVAKLVNHPKVRCASGLLSGGPSDGSGFGWGLWCPGQRGAPMARITGGRHGRPGALRVNELTTLAQIRFREQLLHGHVHEGRIPNVLLTVGKGQVQGLIDRVHIGSLVVAHGPQVKTLEDFQGLREDRPLAPRTGSIDVIAAIVYSHRWRTTHVICFQISHGQQTTLGLAESNRFFCHDSPL